MPIEDFLEQFELDQAQEETLKADNVLQKYIQEIESSNADEDDTAAIKSRIVSRIGYYIENNEFPRIFPGLKF